MASNNNLTNNTNIKIEPGASTQRLPSLKPPRDLSLSAFKLNLPGNTNQPPKKKIYVPNLNVQRNRPQVNNSAPVIKQEPNAETNNKQNHGNSPRGRGRGRGRGTRTFIQTTSGLFSGGVEINSRGRGARDRNDGTRVKVELQKPRLNLKNATAVNKTEEDNAMKDLLRDDFMDDPSLDPDYDNCPIKLPLSQATQFFIKDEAIKEEGFKVKTEPQDFADQNSQVSSQNVGQLMEKRS
ncbi:DNA-directed RNA polymerase III subunit RPC4-like [Nilaparvata lugens]|uniref:DNA-directed RNA polymerase III subunit RPC4-like n=1 Tax=Nilaparvata lugens TaxID=108931 RepID=UPI00193E8652|nr:DNA-directed RNA polymerase III subunit RPC4-like [Nilaparvata lugens]